MKNLFTLNYIGQALLAMLLIQQVDAQVTQFYKRPVSDSTLSEGFSLHGSSLLYFRNNEYFSGAYPGFTALGANNELSGNYRHGRHFISTGMMYSLAFGQPMRHRVLPVITYQYSLARHLNIVMAPYPALQSINYHKNSLVWTDIFIIPSNTDYSLPTNRGGWMPIYGSIGEITSCMEILLRKNSHREAVSSFIC
ncbi:MAG: hypothetical protein HWD63_14170 [Candidatus Parvibacillus calidus]|nr:MAG: hypothetical protein HWD63_14170 [Candidatus Parvibacillus calidus]